MAVEITFRLGSVTPTSASGITMGEPAYNTVDNRLFVGKGFGITAAWVGAPISNDYLQIAAGLTQQIPTLGAVKDYVNYIAGPTGIDSLTDVATSLKINNDLLSWNSSTSKWINRGVGISAGNFIILGAGGTAGTGKLPAVDGSQLLEVNARYLDGKLREQITDGGVF